MLLKTDTNYGLQNMQGVRQTTREDRFFVCFCRNTPSRRRLPLQYATTQVMIAALKEDRALQ
jgi:hypothetical protein